MISRRSFVRYSAGLGAAAWLARIEQSQAAEPAGVRLNHVGFLPVGAKFALFLTDQAADFDVLDAASGKVVHGGKSALRKGDFGAHCVADFSAFRTAGKYVVRSGGTKSAPFVIDNHVYTPILKDIVAYFAKQRCGDSKTGHAAPCHLDDGVRDDDGKPVDVTGGWHDACDLRKWVTATIYGMQALTRVHELSEQLGIQPGPVLEELRWGNSYFLKMQTADRYVMDWCGGDTGNGYTDNTRGTEDDRRIRTESCELPAQFNFIIAQAAMARLTKDSDKGYAGTCEQAALRCQGWCDPKSPRQVNSIAAAVRASIAMRHFDEPKALERTRKYVKLLLALQVKGERPAGFFRGHLDRPDPAREIMHGNLPLLALCDAIEAYPTDADAGEWRNALRTHVDWLTSFSERSAYGTIPYALYVGADPGGGRRIGDYWYRWFMMPHGEGKPADWWVGVNAHLASNGLGLLKASRLLKDAALAALAQRQLDWVLGTNPFDASTVTGAGRNQPALFVTGEFRPATPVIPGGVMCGIGGKKDDSPDLAAGSYHTCEYWTPMVAYTALLLLELQISGRS